MEEEYNSQRQKKCDISGCNEKGRILAHMGTIEIAYCPRHRKKYGERIIEAMINSRFNYRLSNFLTSIKTEIFMDDKFFCECCGSKMKDLVIKKTEELEWLETYYEENDVKQNLEEELK